MLEFIFYKFEDKSAEIWTSGLVDNRSMATNKLFNIYTCLNILSFKIEANLYINNIKNFVIQMIVRISNCCIFFN